MLSKLLVNQRDNDHEYPIIDLDAFVVEVPLSHAPNRLFAKAQQIQRVDSNTGRYVRAEHLPIADVHGYPTEQRRKTCQPRSS